MKTRILILTAILFLAGCDNKEEQKSANLEPKTEIAKPKISIKKGDAPKADDNKFVKYDIDGERKIDFNLNDETSEATRGIVAYARIKSPYERINFDLMKKRLGRDFILHCSACHDDYANGIIGPSLLDKTSEQIVEMIKKYKFKEKPNPLMLALVNQMSDEQISKIAAEIYEFNKQFKESK